MTDFKQLCKELADDLDGWLEYLANDGYQAGLWDEIQNSSCLIQKVRNILNTENAVLFVESTQEIIRVDKDGFYYKGKFINDAGEAHRLLIDFLNKQQSQSVLTTTLANESD